MADEQTKPASAAETPTAEAQPEKKKSKKDTSAEDTAFNNATSIHVKLYSPFQVYYDDEADSVSAENRTGPFDILPRHRNFITLLVPCDVDIKSKKLGDKKITINRGVMHVHCNEVTIFLDV